MQIYYRKNPKAFVTISKNWNTWHFGGPE